MRDDAGTRLSNRSQLTTSFVGRKETHIIEINIRRRQQRSLVQLKSFAYLYVYFSCQLKTATEGRAEMTEININWGKGKRLY